MQLKVLELFAGIGGVSCAFRGIGQIMAAVDINQNAKTVYELNFDHPYHVVNIECLQACEIIEWGCNSWWISAPCQPFTRRGNQLDDGDARSKALLHLISLLPEVLPDHLLLENVVGFETSRTRSRLIHQLEVLGYSFVETERCPTQMGIPNQRQRYYLVASRIVEVGGEDFAPKRESALRPLSDFLQEGASHRLDLSAAEWNKYSSGINVVTRESTTCNCFTSAYGRSMTKSGSYLSEAKGQVRRFSPFEISNLLGFQQGELPFRFPETLSERQLWKLLGNSISVFVVRQLIQQFISLASKK